MIKKFIKKLLGKSSDSDDSSARSAKTRLGRRVEVAVSEHRIDRRLLDDNAVRVVQTLQRAGHEAYVVGGAVRDLLLGHRPKDFDVATSATPEQVKQLFRRAFIIGRRFRIVHVVFGRGREHEVIEVSTFRALLDADAAEQVSGNEKTSRHQLAGKSAVVGADGRVLRDNVWGPQVEDAARRDFTINGMYYDPETEVVVDYHGGLADVRAGLLRMIGDPEARYREDPVRIIRAVRFSAKLGFEIEKKTRAPMQRCAALLDAVPQSRMFDEMIKLLQTGHALASLNALRAQGLHRGVFPILDTLLSDSAQGSAQEKFVHAALADTDRRVGEGKPVAPSFLLACVLWHEVQARWQALMKQGEHAAPALQLAVDAVFDARIGDISGRGKLAADMREIWQMQPRFERRVGQAPYGLVEQPRFRAGFDFLRLRADIGEAPEALAEWWEDFSLGSDEDREALVAQARTEQQGQRAVGAKGKGKGKGSSRAKPRKSSDTVGGDDSPVGTETGGLTAEAAPSDSAPPSGDAPRAARRPRRRRKPSGQRGQGGGSESGGSSGNGGNSGGSGGSGGSGSSGSSGSSNA